MSYNPSTGGGGSWGTITGTLSSQTDLQSALDAKQATHSDNTVIAASAISRPASGTASLNSPISMSWHAIVTPAITTTYKLRAARGLTTHTTTWTVYDGTGYNTTNHATDNSDKGTSIIAIRIA